MDKRPDGYNVYLAGLIVSVPTDYMNISPVADRYVGSKVGSQPSQLRRPKFFAVGPVLAHKSVLRPEGNLARQSAPHAARQVDISLGANCHRVAAGKILQPEYPIPQFSAFGVKFQEKRPAGPAGHHGPSGVAAGPSRDVNIPRIIDRHGMGCVVARTAELPQPNFLTLLVILFQISVGQSPTPGLPRQRPRGLSHHIHISCTVNADTLGVVGPRSPKLACPGGSLGCEVVGMHQDYAGRKKQGKQHRSAECSQTPSMPASVCSWSFAGFIHLKAPPYCQASILAAGP